MNKFIKIIVINLLGEPGAGKSTAAMDITARLKRKALMQNMFRNSQKIKYMKIMEKFLSIKNIYLANSLSKWEE